MQENISFKLNFRSFNNHIFGQGFAFELKGIGFDCERGRVIQRVLYQINLLAPCLVGCVKPSAPESGRAGESGDQPLSSRIGRAWKIMKNSKILYVY
ncbi:hypothetical protein EVAR_13072_1 [Eumeta japonica]|uniref:Uncharacterized protein n=1 Tax=Eumeta variegata TaxID=151549 RepID=A0A4C2A9J4_EUMVA|nr:hypothetical protein EVAR_13072_1 [Eumeta japonica]